MTLMKSTRFFLAALCWLALTGGRLLAEIPDISGRWQTGESKESVQAIISKTETPDTFTAFINTPRLDPFSRVLDPGNNANDKPVPNFSMNLQLTWNSETSQFICEEKLYKITITPANDRNRLKVEFIPNEQAYKDMKEEERNQLKTNNDLVFNPIWIRSYAIFNGFDNIESKNLIVVSSKEGLSAYNKSQGEWANIDVDPSKYSNEPFSRSRLSDSFFSIVIGDLIYGYSSDAGRWDLLPIPPDQQSKIVPSHGPSSLSVRINDKLYALSPKTGRWTSADDGQAVREKSRSNRSTETSNKINAEEKLAANPRLPGAAEQADRIRGLIKEKGISLEESRTQPEMRDAWNELDKSLSEAFDAKTALERARIQELRRRLDQSEGLIEKRLSQKEKIVKRRARELVEGEETQWPTDDVALVEPHSGEQNKTDQNQTNPSSDLKQRDAWNASDSQSTPEFTSPLQQQVAMLLGLRLAPLTDSDKTQLKKTRYGSGLRIVERLAGFSSRDESVAAGDILVALDKWEITSLENVVWVIDQIERDSVNSHAGNDVPMLDIKMLIVRNGALRISHVIINPLKKAGTTTFITAEREALGLTPDKNDDAEWSLLDRIATVGQELIAAKQDQFYTAHLVKKQVVSRDELDRRNLNLATARRRFENLTEECLSKTTATEAALKAAHQNITFCQESLAHAQAMNNNARAPYTQVIEEKRKLASAETIPAKLEARLKLLHRADEDLKKIKADAKLEETIP